MSVLRIGEDKDHGASNWVLILYQTCTTFEMNCEQELKVCLSNPTNFCYENKFSEQDQREKGVLSKRGCDACFVLNSWKQTEKMEHLFVITWISKSIEQRSMFM